MRMYFFVNMYLSSIQKGIQAGHAVEQYARLFGRTEQYKDYIENYGTWIVLDGGSSTHWSASEVGTMNRILDVLTGNDINHATFAEPFLESTLTAICFLASERVYNREAFPDFKDWLVGFCPECAAFTEKYLKATHEEEYNTWVRNVVGSHKNAVMRELITGARLGI